MKNEHIIGIDIGTYAIKIIITETDGKQESHILHAIKSPSYGFRNGYIVDLEKAEESLALALAKAEKEYKQKITRAHFSIGGVGLTSQYVRTSLQITKKSNEINERNTEELLQKAEDLFSAKYPNKKTLHIIPVKYKVDDRDVLGTPIGMYGNLIEVKVIFVTVLEHHYDAYINIIEKNNVHITDMIASPIADSFSSTSYKQRSQGCILMNIGGETTSLSTFENGILTSLDILTIGSNDITNDIALGLQIPLEIAEETKCSENHDFSKKKVEEIIYARLTDIFELTQRHLQKIKKNRLLPAGVILSGGGSQIENISEYAKRQLMLPAQEVHLSLVSRKTKRNLRIPNSFSTAYGLCSRDIEPKNYSKKFFSLKSWKKRIRYIIQEIMP